MSAAIIIPTTGNPKLKECLMSISNQTYNDYKIYLVTDGKRYETEVNRIVSEVRPYLTEDKLYSITLPENTGANNFYGQRIYAAISYLVNQDFVFFLDEDNWYEDNHITETLNTFNFKTDWVYSLRNIYTKEGDFICQDDCESLGKWPAWNDTNMVDTSCYCLRREVAMKIAQVWIQGKRGEDRVVFSVLNDYFQNYECTKLHTVNYRLGNTTMSVSRDFFEKGNEVMLKKYNGMRFPWLR